MLIDNITNKNITHIFILCKPDGTEIAELYEAYDRNVDGKFPTTDEISFKIPYNLTEHGRTFKNPHFDLVEGDYLIKYIQKHDEIVTLEKFFIIDNPRENSKETDYKEIHCYSREHELNKKIVRNYSFLSRQLYSATNEVDSDGEQRGVLNYLSTLTSWSIDASTIPVDLLNKYRSFDISELTLLSFLVEEVQPAFGCIFLFDTINKRISVKEINDLDGHHGLYISEQNYLKTIGKDVNHEEVVTRLYVYGKDGLSINSINPTGTNFIEDFSFYKQSKFMTQGLIDALNTYEEKLQHHKNNNTFETLLDDLQTLQNQKLALEGDLNTLNSEKTQIEDEIDSRIKLDQDYSDLNTQLQQKQIEIDNKNTEIDAKQTEIDNKIIEIQNFNEEIKRENNFTSDQLIELDYYVREKVWIDNSYETVEELYNEAQNQMTKLSTPPTQFEIEMVDFLNIVEGKIDRNRFKMGSVVTIGFDKFNVDVDVRFVGYNYGLDSNSLKMLFSNTNSIDDPFIYLTDLQKNAITTSTTIDMSKFKWDKSASNESLISKIIDGELETSAKKVVAARDQGVVVDERGIWLTEKDAFGNVKPEQMRIINNKLVISDDGFQSAKLALSPSGLVGERIYGKLLAGTNLIIDSSDSNGNKTFIVDSSGVKIRGASLTIESGLPEGQINTTSTSKWNSAESNAKSYTDDQISEVNTTTTNLQNQINDFSNDGKLTLAEANALENSLKQLEAESTDLISIATDLAIIDKKNNYDNALFDINVDADNNPIGLKPYLADNFINQTSYPIEVTAAQRTEIDNRFDSVQDTKSKLINEISAVREENAKNASVGKGELLNGVKIDITDGLTITRSDDLVKSIFNATDGIKIQRNTSTNDTPNWVDQFYVDTNGVINAEELITKKIKINDGTGNTLIDADTKTIDFTGFDVITGKEDVVKGINITDENGNTTFSVDTSGNVTLSGTITWTDTNKPSYTASEVGAKPSTYSAYDDIGASRLTEINSDGIYTGTLSATQINAGTIDAKYITTEIAQVSNQLQIGSSTNTGNKEIRFNGQNVILDQPLTEGSTSYQLTISAEYAKIDTPSLDLSTVGTINWGNNAPTATLG